MRAGICIVQQALTSEAATMVKQSVSLARRRGHAQVTPLHVASAMLASPTGVLKRACLQCHSHPLQCKALELCFNVALNRLPAAASTSPLSFSPHHHHHHHQYSNDVVPCFSNALVAAFKRAQAHQRRGSIENQQQPILALKIELQQLIISILDDPSVSRVMREAGFSSPQVKSRVEQAVSLEIISSNSHQSPTLQSKDQLIGTTRVPSQPPPSSIKHLDQSYRQEDVMSVLKEIFKKKRNTVIVGESVGTAEGVARGVMEKYNFERQVQFISLPLYSLRNISKEEVEHKLVELRGLTKSYIARGSTNIVLYLGDLMWVSEIWSNYADHHDHDQKRNCYTSHLEQIIMELKRLVCRNFGDEEGRLSLLGVATFQTFMRCKTGQPSLQSIWDLHPITVPVGSLSLSLNFDSYDLKAEMSTMAAPKDGSDQFSRTTSTISSSLPLWLQKYREEKTSIISNTDYKECVQVSNICKKWNDSLGTSTQKHPHNPEKLLFNSCSKSPSFEPKQSPKEYQFWDFEEINDDDCAENVSMFMPADRNEPKPDLLSNPNSSPNSASSSEVMEDTDDGAFKDFNAENFKLLCEEMEKKVPWQKEIIPEIATAILQCRSGTSKRKGNLKLHDHEKDKEESWLFFLGSDSEAKEKIARVVAKLVFGSQISNFVSIGLSSFNNNSSSTEECSRNKRARNELGCSYVHRFGEAVNENPHRVFFMEDLEQVDNCSQKGIKQAIESGRVTLADGETSAPLKDAIVIFSCESFSASPIRSQRSDEVVINKEKDAVHDLEERGPCGSLDLNIAMEGDNGDDDHSDNIGILESVDRQIIFKI